MSTDVAGPEHGPSAVALRLRDFRLRAGLSQQQLADFSTLSVRAIRDIENGRVVRPRQGTCELLMKVLDLDRVPRPVRPVDRRIERMFGRVPPPGAGPDGPFLGRDGELAALTDRYDGEHHRLVTITGIEGVGKTRLAMEFARRASGRGETTVLWMASGDTSRVLVGAGNDGVRRVRDAVADRNALIVFDGDWRVADLAGVVERLLGDCPGLRIAVTARHPTGLRAESLLPLTPLGVPAAATDAATDADPAADATADPGADPGAVERADAVRLFLTHARRLMPSFRLTVHNAGAVARICRALDGIPAAVEYAARWTLVYSPQELARLLEANPLLASRPPDAAAPEARDLFASVCHTIGGLTHRQRRLLSTTPQHGPWWTLPEAAAVLGVGVAECAHDIVALLTLGLLRRRDEGERVVFDTLNVVRFLCGDHGEHR
jgi:transcriptional regulator with XRE-family HTH domain